MISNEQLRSALEEYDAARIEALPEPAGCVHHFSNGFERKMRGVCRRAKHPVAYKALQRAACILLAILALFGGVAVLNPQVRAAVIKWVKEPFGQFTHYYPTEETTPEALDRTQYELGWLPEGYACIDRICDERDETVVYVNDSGRLLCLNCYYPGSSGPFLNTSKHILKTVSFGDLTADMYLSRNPDHNSSIVWTDPESGLLFTISAGVNEKDLVKLLQHVAERK